MKLEITDEKGNILNVEQDKNNIKLTINEESFFLEKDKVRLLSTTMKEIGSDIFNYEKE